MKKVYYLLFALFLCGSYTASAQSVKDSFEIYFEFNKAIVKDVSKTQIDSFLRATTGRRIITRIVGHACDIGTDAHNINLSENRAKAAFEYLRSAGEPVEKTELLFHGESLPVYHSDLDRRVVVYYQVPSSDVVSTETVDKKAQPSRLGTWAVVVLVLVFVFWIRPYWMEAHPEDEIALVLSFLLLLPILAMLGL